MAFVGNFGKKGSRYSVAETKNFFGTEEPKFDLVSSSLQEVYKWDDSQRRYTDELDHTNVMVASSGIEPFSVKLPVFDENGEKITLNGAKYLDKICFDNLETYRNGSRVYFRAKGIKKVKE